MGLRNATAAPDSGVFGTKILWSAHLFFLSTWLRCELGKSESVEMDQWTPGLNWWSHSPVITPQQLSPRHWACSSSAGGLIFLGSCRADQSLSLRVPQSVRVSSPSELRGGLWAMLGAVKMEGHETGHPDWSSYYAEPEVRTFIHTPPVCSSILALR